MIDQKEKKVPRVYVSLTFDVLHHGHINIIRAASELGDVTVGLLTDSAIAGHKRLPYLSWDQRRSIALELKGVQAVVPQNSWSEASNILALKPDFVVHGDDWRQGREARFRTETIEALSCYGGELVEIPYTEGVSTGAILTDGRFIGSTTEIRRSALKRKLLSKNMVRLIEAHSPISALVAEAAAESVDGEFREFDGFWSSSLTDSTERGKPDIEALDITSRLRNINDIFEVTTKPLVMDCDTGGLKEHFELYIKSIERLGVSAAVIEDKQGLKKNSLLGKDVKQTLADPMEFCEKILAGKAAITSPDFMIIARIESLILELGVQDALNRATAYSGAGADGIVIHSRHADTAEIFEFSNEFKKEFPDIPLVAIPTSYNQVTEQELEDQGFNVVIYANHLLRSAYPSMIRTASSILRHGRSYEIESELLSIKEVLALIPGTN